MRLNKILLVSIILLAVVSLGAVSASENTTSDVISDTIDYEVASDSYESEEITSDDEDDSSITVDNWEDLQYYCSLNDKNYTLKLKENTNYYPKNPEDISYQIKVKNNVTIIGSEGSFIGPESNESKLKFTSIVVPDNSKSALILFNVTFKGIFTDYRPDAALIQIGGNQNSVIKNCTFKDIATTLMYSSVIYLKGSTTVDNCTFINCTTHSGCIKLFEENNAGVEAIIQNCYFERNQATSDAGCIKNGGRMRIYNSTFCRNTANTWAGAIHTRPNANTSIYNSQFIDNLAGWNGGALYTYSYLQIYNSTFVGNNCTTNYGGGAIGACKFGSEPHVYIVDSLFMNNENLCWGLDSLSTFSLGRGGAVSLMDSGSLDVINSTFVENSAALAPAIWASKEAGYGCPNVRIEGNKFINHTRVGDVLIIKVDKNQTTIVNNNYLNNSIAFSKLNIDAVEIRKDSATFKITVVLNNPDYYDEDLINRTLFEIYVNDKLEKTVNGSVFDIDFKDIDEFRIYAIPSISNSKTNELKLTKTELTVFGDEVEYGQDATIKVNLTAVDVFDTEIIITINGINISGNITSNTLCDIIINSNILVEGLNNISVLYAGDNSHKSSTNQSAVLMNININKFTKIIFTQHDTIKLLDSEGNGLAFESLKIIINNSSYTVMTDMNGESLLNFNHLKYGVYPINVSFEGNEFYYHSHIEDVFNVTTNSIIEIISIDGGKLELNGVLKTIEGELIKNTLISYSIGGVGRNTTTDDSGMFILKIDNNALLNIIYSGNQTIKNTTYTILLKNINPVKKGTNITVDKTFTRTAVDFPAGEKGYMFYFTLKDTDGKALANKEAKIGVSGKIYTVKTDKNGKAGLMINLANANVYTYAISFLGDDDYKASFAVSKLTVVKKAVTITPAKTSYTFKSAAKSKVITATLKSTNKFIPAGKKATLTVGGKIYSAVVAKNGKISLNIAKLTKKGTYKVTIKYSSDGTYKAAASKTITIKIA